MDLLCKLWALGGDVIFVISLCGVGFKVSELDTRKDYAVSLLKSSKLCFVLEGSFMRVVGGQGVAQDRFVLRFRDTRGYMHGSL